MIFLIRYSRSDGVVEEIQEFENSERQIASTRGLEMEIDLVSRNVKNEVVILEAQNIDALKVTHKRYFSNVADLASSK